MADILDKSENTTPVSTDKLYLVDDPAGTPADNNVTAGNLITKGHGLSDGIVKVSSGTMTPALAGTDYAEATHSHTESDITDLDHDAVKLRGVGLDSTVGTPSDGDILVYRSAGSDWVLESKPAGGSNPALNDVTDVTITTVADNEVLAYDNGSSTWINQTPAEAGLQAELAEGAFVDGDKTKLDGIESGATADQNASEVSFDGTALSTSETDVQGIIDEIGLAVGTILSDSVNTVTSGSNITDHALVRGDGGAKVVQDTGVTIDDSDNMTISGDVNVTDFHSVYSTYYRNGAGATGLQIQAGSSTTGGDVMLTSGQGSSGAGGNIILTPESGTTTDGQVKFRQHTTNYEAGFDISALTANRTITVPNADVDLGNIPTGSVVDTANSPVANDIARFTDSDTIEGLSYSELRTAINVEDGADVTDATNVTTALSSIGVSAHSDVDTDKSKTPADGDVLTFDGTHWNAEAPAGGGGGNPYNADLVVASSGGDYTTLGEAVANASAGDVIYVEPGTYTETANRTETNRVHIIGASKETVKIQLSSYVMTLDGDDTTMENLTVELDGSGGYMDFGGARATVRHCHFTSSANTTSSWLRMTGTSQKVHDNTGYSAHSIGGIGFDIQGVQSSFSNNNITVNQVTAFYNLLRVLGASCNISDNNLMVTTPVFNGRTVGLSSSRGNFTGNYVTGGTPVYVLTGPITITGNTIECTLANAECINLDSGATFIVTGNLFMASATNVTGLRVDRNGALITGNVFQGFSNGTAISATAGDYGSIIGNSFKDWSTGISLSSSAMDKWIVMGNQLSDNVTTGISDSGTGTLKVTATDSDALNQT